MSDDLEARVERLEEEVGFERNDLPQFGEYQMVKEHPYGFPARLFTDEEGDYWIEITDRRGAFCMVGEDSVRSFTNKVEEAFIDD